MTKVDNHCSTSSLLPEVPQFPWIWKFSTRLWEFPTGSLLLLRGSIIIRCSENCKVSIGEMKQTIISFNFPCNLIFWKYFKAYWLEAVAEAFSRSLQRLQSRSLPGSWETAKESQGSPGLSRSGVA